MFRKILEAAVNSHYINRCSL